MWFCMICFIIFINIINSYFLKIKFIVINRILELIVIFKSIKMNDYNFSNYLDN